MSSPRVAFQVNAALASSPGPWFLPSSASDDEAANGSPDEGFSLVDLTYVPREETQSSSDILAVLKLVHRPQGRLYA